MDAAAVLALLSSPAVTAALGVIGTLLAHRFALIPDVRPAAQPAAPAVATPAAPVVTTPAHAAPASPALAGHPFLNGLLTALMPVLGQAKAGASLSTAEQELISFGAPILRDLLDAVAPLPTSTAPATPAVPVASPTVSK